jgi:hypothetical protein
MSAGLFDDHHLPLTTIENPLLAQEPDLIDRMMAFRAIVIDRLLDDLIEHDRQEKSWIHCSTPWMTPKWSPSSCASGPNQAGAQPIWINSTRVGERRFLLHGGR